VTSAELPIVAESSTEPKAVRQPLVNQAVLAAVVDAYYPDLVRLGATARVRTQAAQAAATVTAAGVIGLLISPAAGASSVIMRIVGGLAVISWLIAAGMYMRAVGAPPDFDGRITGAFDEDELVREVLARAKDERQQVDVKRRVANRATVVAIILTSATLLCLSILGRVDEKKPAVLLLDTAQATLLRGECGYLGASATGVAVYAAGADLPATFAVDRRLCKNNEVSLVLLPSGVDQLILNEDR
jgi:hypothetical protein